MNRFNTLLKLSPVFLISACGLQQELGDSPGFDPLSGPGTRKAKQKVEVVTGEGEIGQGSQVSAMYASTSFFSEFPNASSKPSSVLAKGASLEVLENKGPIYRVRQVESGLEGYVVASAVTTAPVITEAEETELAALEEGVNIESFEVDIETLSDDLVLDPVTTVEVLPDDGVAPGTIVEVAPSENLPNMIEVTEPTESLDATLEKEVEEVIEEVTPE